MNYYISDLLIEFDTFIKVEKNLSQKTRNAYKYDLKRFYSFLIKKYDINIVCANSLIAATFTVIPARILGKRFIYYEHNIAEQRKGHLIGLALQPVARLATEIVCISESVKDSLKQEGIPSPKLHLIYNIILL